ncbi:CD80-like C2-set immunoglobulin domain [Nesidiocoris tenuis]|uniref:CD80-like C2-set immunoglobulin domain n=2 Tax=Nesidiocoris tenuis TaxID=355587 RepID=A0ABN7AK11_9HEMI|nr:CD80-like C2-set immunoglobulin domain [Nesidiocoris tenuis]
MHPCDCSSSSGVVMVSHTEAVFGGVAKLPCDVTPPAKADRVHLVIWYKEGLPSPIYSVDARNMTMEGGRHWSEERALGGRAFFQSNTDPARLTIESVKDTDGGVYRCRVDFRKSPTRNTKVNLTVILPPDKLAVLDEKGAHIPHYILGPYNEGATVDITCISTGGRPLPRVTWWQENALLDDSYEVISDRKVKNVLRVSQLERRHLHAVFTCQASNNNYLAPISSSVTLDLNLKPLTVRMVGENKPLSADKTYEISCEVRGARPPPFITWWKGSAQLRNTRETTSSDGNKTTSTLILVPTIEDSGKYLSCRAVNTLIPDSGIEDGWKLNIFHVPIVTLELGSNLNGSWIREGVDVYFECNIKSNPWVYKVSWRHNGNIVVNNPSGGIILANQSLVLQSVDRSKGGLYTCVASNGEGDGESNPLLLNIKFSPVCRPGQGNVVGVGKGETAKIPCEVEANPPSTDFTWRFNNTGESIEIAGNQFSSEPNHSVITYTPHTEHDFGTLLCWARNPLGTMGRPCAFHIIPAGRPDTLLNCTLVNQTETALGIECSEGFDGGLPQYFLVEVFSQGTGKAYVSNVTSASPSLTVTGLPPGGTYEVHAYAVNAKGRSDATVLHAYTLKSPQKQTESPGKSSLTVRWLLFTAVSPGAMELVPIIGILAGVVVTLVSIAICAVLALRCRESRTKNCRYETDKLSDIKQRPLNQSCESLENNPDIIPLSTEFQDSEDKLLDKVNSKLYPTDINIINSTKPPKSDVTYADLNLAGSCSVYSELLSPRGEPTVYAQINPGHHRLNHIPHHTTVNGCNNPRRCDTLGRSNPAHGSSTSRMGVVTTTRF